MKNFFIALFVFGCSSSIVIAFVSFEVPMRNTQQFLALLIVVILITGNLFYHSLMKSYGKWMLLFLVSLVVQLLVIATGGLSSPFFILFYLVTFGISILFNLNISVLFLAFSFWVLIGSLALDQETRISLQQDPIAAILYGVSFIAIIPLAQLFAHKYKFKDKIMTMMTNQIEVEESIIEELNELIFVTDKDATILSVNDAVVQTLRLSKSELVNHSLFSVLFLKDKDGKELTQDTLKLDALLIENTTKTLRGISLLTTAALNLQQVSLRIKPVISLNGIVDQISFIISTTAQIITTPHRQLEEANARHDAMVEEMKQKLRAGKSSELHKFILITQSEKDILTARAIEDHGIQEKKVLVDIAALSKQAVASEEIFAEGFHVPLEFKINSFGEKDIAPLVTSPLPIKPELFTGPFFTAPSEVKYVSMTLQKLLEIGILLASSEKDPFVSLSIEREGEMRLFIKIIISSPEFTEQEQLDLFVMYYGMLARKTNLNLGSGLEGYLAKKITDILNIPLFVKTEKEPNRLTFLLRLNKEPS